MEKNVLHGECLPGTFYVVDNLLQHPAFRCCSHSARWQVRWQMGVQVAHLHSHRSVNQSSLHHIQQTKIS